MNELQGIIGYKFKDVELLTLALTHSSHANEKGLDKAMCNERLEFLGDAVLELLMSEHIFTSYPTMPEGEMTKLRASLVCEKSLYLRAKKMSIGNFLLLGKGEEATGGRTRSSILADAVEAVLGAIYIDGGIDVARDYVRTIFEEGLEGARNKNFDFKTELQEIIQSKSQEPVQYVLIEEKGPDHDKHFVSEAHHCGNVIGRGEGRTKKQSEQMAAKMAIENDK